MSDNQNAENFVKPDELMIGNYVCFCGDKEFTCPVKIDTISQWEAAVNGDWFDLWLGIPLTTEILENNGFNVDTYGENGHLKNAWKRIDNDWYLEAEFDTIKNTIYFKFDVPNHYYSTNSIKYVHELQNIIKRFNLNIDIAL